MTQVVYITPNYEGEWMVSELEQMPKDELKTFVRNNSDENIVVYSMSDFQQNFNCGLISDEGYIIFI